MKHRTAYDSQKLTAGNRNDAKQYAHNQKNESVYPPTRAVRSLFIFFISAVSQNEYPALDILTDIILPVHYNISAIKTQSIKCKISYFFNFLSKFMNARFLRLFISRSLFFT